MFMICKSEFEVLKFDIKHNIKFILKLNLFKGDFSFNYMFCINAINILTPLENCNVHSQVSKRTKERREEGGEGGGRGKREGGEEEFRETWFPGKTKKSSDLSRR